MLTLRSLLGSATILKARDAQDAQSLLRRIQRLYFRGGRSGISVTSL